MDRLHVRQSFVQCLKRGNKQENILGIHPTAVINPGAEIGSGAEIGPYSVIGEHVKIGNKVRIGSHVAIEGRTEVGDGCSLFPFSSIGTAPQDLKYKGEETRLKIGRENIFREFVTVNRGTKQGGGETYIGDSNLFMAYVHIAHDCQIGNNVVMANAATLAGHISIGSYAIIGGLVGIHQFVRIGEYAMIGGCSAVAQDVPPFLSAVGNRARIYGVNRVGLKRHGFSSDRLEKLKEAHKILFRSGLALKEAIKKTREEVKDSLDVESLLQFIESSERGICR